MKHYCVTIDNYRPAGTPERVGHVQIVWPFAGESAAARWGKLWQIRNEDNPCWHTVTLPDGFVPTIRSPEAKEAA